ncbi:MULTISPECIES: pentapeptide repeat-containing protein [unclassified Stenotrophomonas]|uniref:pentapeptide repeat-containing protein n=1 Tax=unclassified Stenotrophomonas TaxID=196198 RepID=UPI001F22262B|nr:MULTISPECIES: pentapeptide repeat-containing protein [unclassified Stenotrophomonas]
MAATRLKLLPKRDIAALRARWTPERVPQLANPRRRDDWRDKTITNRHWHPSPFGLTAEGRLDYRGFPYAVPQYQNLQSVDLSYVSPSHGTTFLVHAVMEDCDFTGAAMGTLDESFLRCRFDLTTFDNNGLSGVFNACSFVQAKLLRCHSNAHFIDCDFRDAALPMRTSPARASCAAILKVPASSAPTCTKRSSSAAGPVTHSWQTAIATMTSASRAKREVIEVTMPAPAEHPLLAWTDRYLKRLEGEG